MYCKNCGKDIRDSKFCPFCGERVLDETNEVNPEEKDQGNDSGEDKNDDKNKNPLCGKKGIIAGSAILLIIVVIVGTVIFSKKMSASDEKDPEVSESIEEDTQQVQETEIEETDVVDEKSEIVEEEVTDTEEDEINEDKTESQVLETPRIRELKWTANNESRVWKFDSDGDPIYSENIYKSDEGQNSMKYNYTYLLDENGNKVYGLVPKGLFETGSGFSSGSIKDGPLLSAVTQENYYDGRKGQVYQYEYLYDDQNRLISANCISSVYNVEGVFAGQFMSEGNFTYDNNIISCYVKFGIQDNGDYNYESSWKEKYDSDNQIIEYFDGIRKNSEDNMQEMENIEYKYDDAGRLISKSGEKVYNWEYDEEGRLVHSESSLGSDDYEYDEFGRLLKHYSSGFWTKYYNYDENNLCVSINLIADSPESNPERVNNAKNEGYDPEAEFIFSYDEKNRLIKAQVCNSLSSEESGPLWSEPYEITIEYDENNLPSCIRSSKEDAILWEDIEDILRQQYSEETQKTLFYGAFYYCLDGMGDFSYVTD